MSSIVRQEASPQLIELGRRVTRALERPPPEDRSQGLSYYAQCFAAGAVSSSIRFPLSPLEMIKTRMQADSMRIQNSTNAMGTKPSRNSLYSHFVSSIKSKNGVRELFVGASPTFLAYASQTAIKYSLYETFKDLMTDYVGSSNRGMVYVTAAATAEVVADIFMCPWEMIRVRMQTDPKFPKRLRPAIGEMLHNQNLYNFPFGSLGPIIMRQVPSTIVNFYTFENTVSWIYTNILQTQKDPSGNSVEINKSDFSLLTQLGVTFTAGYVAGACCAVVSHPADSMISLKGSHQRYMDKSYLQIIQEVGFYRLATNGLSTRILMIGSIISSQWLIYDSVKTLLGLGTSGGTT